MGAEVFISYPYQDADVAEAVCSGLETEGMSCWIAELDLVGGQPADRQIVEAIKHARVLVVVLSSHSGASRGLRRELDLARGQGKTLIGFRIDGEVATQLVEQYLGPVSWIDASHPPLQGKIGLLARTVKKSLEKSGDLPLKPMRRREPCGSLRNPVLPARAVPVYYLRLRLTS